MFLNITKIINIINYIGDWGLGIGDWGLGIGGWAQCPMPKPPTQTPIPQCTIF